MPIYAYRCESCGFAKDVLQKVSDAPLSNCPECGKSSFKKQLTAAGFQLKGTGWYATDFRNNASGAGSKTASSSSSTSPSATSSSSSSEGAASGPASSSTEPAA